MNDVDLSIVLASGANTTHLPLTYAFTTEKMAARCDHRLSENVEADGALVVFAVMDPGICKLEYRRESGVITVGRVQTSVVALLFSADCLNLFFTMTTNSGETSRFARFKTSS